MRPVHQHVRGALAHAGAMVSIDTRHAADFAAEHIPGTINIACWVDVPLSDGDPLRRGNSPAIPLNERGVGVARV